MCIFRYINIFIHREEEAAAMAASDKELELQLMESGNRLVEPPSSVDELISLLDVIPNFYVFILIFVSLFSFYSLIYVLCYACGFIFVVCFLAIKVCSISIPPFMIYSYICSEVFSFFFFACFSLV